MGNTVFAAGHLHLALCAKLKSNISKGNFGFGSITVKYNMTCVTKNLQTSLHPIKQPFYILSPPYQAAFLLSTNIISPIDGVQKPF